MNTNVLRKTAACIRCNMSYNVRFTGKKIFISSSTSSRYFYFEDKKKTFINNDILDIDNLIEHGYFKKQHRCGLIK